MTESAQAPGLGRLNPRPWVRFAVLASALTLLWGLYQGMPVLFNSLMLAVGLFYVLNPLVDFLETHSIRRGLATVVVLAGFIAGVCILWTGVANVTADLRSKIGLEMFQKNLVSKVYGAVAWSEQKVPGLTVPIERALERQRHAPEQSHPAPLSHADESPRPDAPASQDPEMEILKQKVDSWMEKAAQELAPALALQAGKWVSEVLVAWVLTFYLVFFFLRDGHSFKKALIQWVPNRFFETALKFCHEMNQRIELHLRRMMLDCFLVGLLVGVGSALAGVSYPVLFGLIAFVFNAIPFLGPLLYGAIGVIIAVGMGEPTRVVLGFLVVFIVSRLCDDLVLAPTIYGRGHNIHPVLIVLSVLVGESLAGVSGMLLAVPITSLILLSLKIAREISHGQHATPLPPSAYAPFA